MRQSQFESEWRLQFQMKSKYTLHNFKDKCVKCIVNADRFFIHYNASLNTYFGIYGYCKVCLKRTLVGRRGPEDIEVFREHGYTWEDYLYVHKIIQE